MTLKDMRPGGSGLIVSVGGQGSLRRHLLDMGLIPGAAVTVVKYAPMGDPIEITVHGYSLTLRLDDAARITVSTDMSHAEPELHEYPAIEAVSKERHPHDPEHPGYGEEGRYHDRSGEHPLPKGEVLTFALAGNQNCGKTTLFNALTGANQHVGNFPGVTVDRKSGPIRGYADTLVTDLPGIYSLSPYSDEELISRSFILREHPSCIINIVDATNIERNLYLTLQLMELDVPMVLALNMMDEMRNNEGSIRINEMEQILGIPVIPISASKEEGVEELCLHAVHVARFQEKSPRTDFCGQEHGGAVHRCLHGIRHLIEDHAEAAGIPARFAASKLVEGDPLIALALDLTQNEQEMIEHIISQMEEERGLDRAAAIADMRFSFIQALCGKTVVKPVESKEHARSRRIDKVLTGRYTAIPAFLIIMGLVFWLTFNVVGAWLQDLLAGGIDLLTERTDAFLSGLGISKVLHSLVVDGVFTGVGSVVSFIPIIVVLFFFLSLLEDSGYMARIAFVMDKLLRKVGLSGKSMVPMLIGFGCSVPAVMSSRTLSSERDRKLTILLIPFMSCTAKLPIYGFFTAAFFPGHGGAIMVGLYLLGIAAGILVALVSKRTFFRGEAIPFVMELPNYRIPGAKNTLHLLWDKAKDFLQRAFTIIFAASIVVWFLQSFDFRLQLVADPQESILASLAGLAAPLFAPQGFGDWRVVTSLFAGFLAKESVISSLSVLFGSTDMLLAAVSQASAGALLVFCLLYTPCCAAIASIKRELGAAWAAAVVVLQCVIAWVFSLAAYGLLSFLS
ncbi:MAG: ferrous iron transport protein B [Desulfovibrio sp.]|jgi:ferrous iron transport protein B|nr:ferrous iron transport protein B [Mailhella sp.]